MVHACAHTLAVHLRNIAVFLDVPLLMKPEVHVRRWNNDWSETTFDAAGNVIDAATQANVTKLVEALGKWVRVISAGRTIVD